MTLTARLSLIWRRRAAAAIAEDDPAIPGTDWATAAHSNLLTRCSSPDGGLARTVLVRPWRPFWTAWPSRAGCDRLSDRYLIPRHLNRAVSTQAA